MKFLLRSVEAKRNIFLFNLLLYGFCRAQHRFYYGFSFFSIWNGLVFLYDRLGDQPHSAHENGRKNTYIFHSLRSVWNFFFFILPSFKWEKSSSRQICLISSPPFGFFSFFSSSFMIFIHAHLASMMRLILGLGSFFLFLWHCRVDHMIVFG